MNRFLTLVASVSLTLSAFAAGEGVDVWTFEQCVAYAREHNIDLLQSRLAREVTGRELAEAKAQWQPSLDFGTSHSFTNTPWGEAKKNSYVGNFSLTGSWTVWNGGVRENTIRLRELQGEVDDLSTEDLSRKIDTQLLSVYLNILYAAESVTVYENALSLSTANAERAYELWQAGRLSKVDWAQLKSQQEQDNYSLVNARGTYATRILELKNLLQLGIDSNVEPAPVSWPDSEVTASLPPMDETYLLACELDPQLSSLALRSDMADINLKIANAGRLPSIGLNAGVASGYAIPNGNVGDQMKRSLNEQIGFSLTLPIFDRRKTKTAIEKARLDQIGVGYDVDSRRQELAQNVEKWYIDTNDARRRFTAAIAREEAARLTDDLVNEQFRLGLVNTIELLQAHNDLIDASHSTLQAKYLAILGQRMIHYYRTAIVSL